MSPVCTYGVWLLDLGSNRRAKGKDLKLQQADLSVGFLLTKLV